MSGAQHFQATGKLGSWPKNVPGKPTHVAVMGVDHPKKGKTFEILWTGDFPVLDPAMYWTAKKEIEAIRKSKCNIATRVLWQYELTPEPAVQTVYKDMEPQIDRMTTGLHAGIISELGEDPMKPIDPKDVKGY